jgi:iron(III) transport system permease protein
MRRWKSSRTWVLGIAVLVFVVCCVLPVASLFLEILRRPAAITSELLLDARRRGLLFNTVALGAGAAVVASVIGVPLGILLGRVPFPAKGLIRIALAAPAFIPPYVMALAWVYLGIGLPFVSRDVASGWTYSLPAAVLVLALVFYPLSMLAAEVAIRRVDGRFEEAGLMVARPRRVLLRITLPLAAPVTIAAGLLIFVLAISEFGVPGLLRVRVYTTEVFTAFAALYDAARAVVLTLPLLALCAIVAAIAAAVVGDRLVTSRRTVSMQPLFAERWRRPGVVFAFLIIAAALVAPLVVLGRQAAGAESPAAVLAGSTTAIANSLTLAAAGATLVVAVAIWLGYFRARTSHHGHAADIIFLVLFAIPSTVVGVGLIGLWNRPGLPGAVYDSNSMFVIGYLARFVPVAALMLAASARYVPLAHEEAAAVGGAHWPRTVARIVLPQMRLGIAAAWIVVFVLAFGELGVSILVAPPGEATLPIRIYTMIANTPPSHVAVFALLQTAIVLIGVVALGALASSRHVR